MKTAYKLLYKVRKNDTLPIIGKVLEINWLFIYYMNKQTIGGNPEIIQVGQELFVPTQKVVDAWNTIMGSTWVQSLSHDWINQSKQLEKLIKYSSAGHTEEGICYMCGELKLDMSIGKLLWSMRIENGMNPWKEISEIIAQLIHSGLENRVLNKNQNLGD